MDTTEADDQPVVVKRKIKRRRRRRWLETTDSAFDHVWPWAVASIAIVSVVALFTNAEITGIFIVVGVGVSLFSLCGLLTLRLALCGICKRTPELRVFRSWQLRGFLAVVFPPVLFMMIVFARELSVFHLGMNKAAVSCSLDTEMSSRSSDQVIRMSTTIPQKGGSSKEHISTHRIPGPAPSGLSYLRLPRGAGSFIVAFNDAMEPLRSHVFRGVIDITCTPPESYFPLFKSAVTPFSASAQLTVGTSSFQFDFKGTTKARVTGFAPSHVLSAKVGKSIGSKLRDTILQLISREMSKRKKQP